MWRKLAAKLFGFERRIEELEKQIKELSWDTSFGMWTRGAFLQFCHVMPRGDRIVVFIDLDDIAALNKQHGYTEVDRRVQETFSVPFRRSDLVARWYSGDEIIILFDGDMDGAQRKIAELEEAAQRQGLSFIYEVGAWKVGKERIEVVVERLSEELVGRKSRR